MEEAKQEFIRILKPGGKVALIWNVRVQEGDDFSFAYGAMWKEQQKEDKNNMSSEDFEHFFTHGYEVKTFHNEQAFDLEGLIGRSFSSSFSPKLNSFEGELFSGKIRDLFSRYQHEGVVKIFYQTKLYMGKLDSPQKG